MLPLYQKGLSLTQPRFPSSLDAGSRHQSGDIGQDVSKGGKEDQSVDRFAKLVADAESGDDKGTADQGQNRGGSFDDNNGPNLLCAQSHFSP